MQKQKRGELGRKAQITVFIILGILILFGSASYIYVKTRVMKEEVSVPEILIPKSPAEVQPIKTFVESCVKQTAEDGLRVLEDHGGYTEFSKFKPNPVFSTEGNAVEVIKGSNIFIPYWQYLSSSNNCRNNCKFDSLMLPLTGQNSIETQLESYIKSNLKECLNNFDVFADQGIKVAEKGGIKPKVNIREQDIAVKVDYPLNVNIKGKEITIKSYSTRISSKISELYKIANDLIDYELNNCFIEKQTLNYLSYYQGLGEGDIPPISESTIGTRKEKIWIKPEVEKQVKTLTMSGLRLLQIFNSTMNWPKAPLQGDFYDTLRQSIYDQNIFFPLKKEHDAKIEFNYNGQEPYFDIPSESMLLKPTTSGDFAGKMGILGTILQFTITKDYSFSYQYSFPTIIDITVPTDTGIERLRFAVEANIRNNACFKPDSSYSITSGGKTSLLCDLDQRTGKNISIKVTDKETGKSLDNVAVYFSAGDSCDIGETDENGELKTQLPDAFGWILNLKKQGYADFYVHEQDFTTSDLKMTPLTELNVSFAVINESSYKNLSEMRYSERQQKRDQYLTNLNENYTVTLQLTRIKEKYNDPEIEEIISFINGKIVPSTIRLVPGKYTIDAQSFLSGNFTIPEERDKKCEVTKNILKGKCRTNRYNPPQSCGKDCLILAACTGSCKIQEDIIYPKQNLAMIINGGAQRNESDPYIITDRMLKDKTEIQFYLYSQNPPARQHDLEEMEKYKKWKTDLITPKIR